MVKCIIVDDEPLAQQVLQRHISQTSSLQLLKTCSNALEAFSVISQQSVDLLFLDIKLPLVNGIDFIRQLNSPPAVIFTTAFSEYAVVSYELEAVDYLLKPITYERFCASIAKFSKLSKPLEAERTYTYFKVDGQLVKVSHDDLLYAKSIKDYLLLHTLRGNYITHMTMKYLTTLLPETTFKRVHRSYLVNTTHVTLLGRNVLEIGSVSIPIGENYKIDLDVFRKALMKE